MKNKTIAIIPARGGSKRLPNKNILLLDGIPLIAHSILYAKENSSIIDEVYISTDDEKIKEIATKFGAKVIDRPKAISGDLEPTISALQHAINAIGLDIENIVLLQPTNPLRPKTLLKDCFEIYQNLNCDSLFTVTQNHQKLGKIINNKYVAFNYEIGQRSQDLEPLYYENGLLYISKTKAILEGNIISKNAFPYIENHIFATIDIDTNEDLEYAKYVLNLKVK